MSDTADRLGGSFGLPPELVVALRNKYAATAPPAASAPAASPGPRPGEAGFDLTNAGGAPVVPFGPPRPPAPAGPKPGERGFSLAASAPAGTPAQGAPSKPMSRAEALANIQGTNDAVAAVQHGASGPMVDMTGAKGGDAKRLADVSAPYSADRPQTAMEEARAGVAGAQTSGSAGAGGGTPAGWVPGTHSMQVQHGYSPDELGPLTDTTSQLDALSKEQMEKSEYLGKQQGIRDAAYNKANTLATMKANDEIAAVDQAKADYVNAWQKHSDQLAAQANAKVDPEAYFKEKGTLGRVMAAIAVGLGQFGASMRGGPNTAWDIINSQINANIKGQQDNIANARGAIDVENSQLAQNTRAFGDKKAGILQTKLNGLDQVGAMLDAKLADTTLDERSRMGAIDLQKRYLTERKAIQEELLRLAHSQVSEASSEHYSMGGPAGGAGDSHAYSEELEKAGIPAAYSGLVDIDRTVDSMGDGPIAGIGAADRYVPDWMAKHVFGDSAISARQAVQALKNNIGHAKFGGALSPTEAQKLDAELEGAHDASSLRRVVQSFRQALSIRQKNIQAGHKPQDIAAYESRGGSVPRDIPLSKPTTPYQRPVGEEKK